MNNKTFSRFIFFAFAMLLLCQGIVMAQSPTAQRDTIYGRNPTYMYQNGWADPFDSIQPPNDRYGHGPSVRNVNIGLNSHPTYPYNIIAPEMASKFYTDTTVKIIGAATCIDLERLTYPGGPTTYGLEDWIEYLKIYKHTQIGTMQMVAEKDFTVLDTTRWMYSYPGPMVDSGNIFIDHDETRYFYVYEVYFDKPIVTSDSFYVALTQQSRQMDSIFVGQGEIVTCFHNEYGPSLRYLAIPTDSVIQNLSDSVFDALYGNGYAELDLHYQWHFYTQSRNGRPGSAMTYLTFPCLFPIIDTTGMGLRPVSLPCDEVTGLNVASTWDRNALLRWDGGRYNDKWELAVGRADADPSTYHVYPVTVTNKVLSDLDSNVVYAARVRAECFPNGRNYSGWSDTVQFNIGMSQEPISIANRVDRFTFLMPNPAKERVNVMSSFALRHIDIYDLTGRSVLSRDCKGMTEEIDLTGLGGGTYLVVVTTNQGSTMKKLVVD